MRGTVGKALADLLPDEAILGDTSLGSEVVGSGVSVPLVAPVSELSLIHI